MIRTCSASPLVVLLTIAVLAGCAPAEPLAQTAEQTPRVSVPIDGLVIPTLPGSVLDREDLQRIANLQNARDTVGLLRHLQDSDPAVRARVALAFGSVRSPVAAPALYPLLQDPDARVRALAAFGIGQSELVTAPGVLLDALYREADPAAIVQILDALGRVGDRPALASLVAAEIPSAREADRAIAIARLGIRGVHDPTAVQLLARQLTAAEPRLRRNAAYYFGRITDAAQWQDQVETVIGASSTLETEDEAQLFLATALGRIGIETAEPHILRLLRHSGDWRIRVNAARALGAEGRTPEATTALISAVGEPNHHVAAAAASALATGPLTDAQLDHLEAWVPTRPDQWQVWSGFLPGLVRAGRGDVVYGKLGEDLPVPARAALLRALAVDGTAGGMAALVDATTHPDARVAAAAVDALRQRWQRERGDASPEVFYTTFVQALRRAEGATAFAAAPVLGDTVFLAMGSGIALREVYAELTPVRNVGAMEAIIRAHGAARDSLALDFLVGEAVAARHPVLRTAAVETLTERFEERFHFTTLGGSPPRFPPIDWDYLGTLGPAPRLVLETERGTIVLELHTEWAPATVQAITRFARDGRYDGIPFHRVVPNFVVQGGDIGAGDGFGGPDFFLPSELIPLPYASGTLGMASSGPDTEGSQFFVTHSMQPHLDGRYTVFGRLLYGQDVVDAIRADDRVVRARVEVSR
jgi:cyclophilin family peptidyl-prolyl cis-trans isomerase/HEAT repeat protein